MDLSNEKEVTRTSSKNDGALKAVKIVEHIKLPVEDDDERSDHSSSTSSTSEDLISHLSANQGSFAASSCPIDFMDEEGNLPLTNISALLPAVLEEEEEEDDYHIPFSLPAISPIKERSGEEATLSTVGSESIKSRDVLPSKLTSEKQQQRSDSTVGTHHSSDIEGHQGTSDDTCTSHDCPEDHTRMQAVLALKDVIFKQRSTIKRYSRDKRHLSSKYSRCKSKKEEILKENSSMQKRMSKLSDENNALEAEIRKLKEALAKSELGTNKSQAHADGKPSFIYALLQLNEERTDKAEK